MPIADLERGSPLSGPEHCRPSPIRHGAAQPQPPLPRLRLRWLALLAATTLCAAPAWAFELGSSGFATLGLAKSDSSYRLQRWIDDEGSFERDSVLGGQVDLRLSATLSATLQARVAPSDRKEAWTLQASWAFVGWRPNDEWLLRAGKLRVPLYLHSESMDLGTATPLARLPSEMYWITPAQDFTGLYATRFFNVHGSELSVDAYGGRADTAFRNWSRDGIPGAVAPGAVFRPVRVTSTGLVFTLRDNRSTWRGGLHHVRTARLDSDSFTRQYPLVTLAPGLSYYKVDDAMPGPPLERVSAVRNVLFTLGGDVHLGEGWRVMAEATHIKQLDVEVGANADTGYAALMKTFGRVTPYVSVSRMLSSKGDRDLRQQLLASQLPPQVPQAALFNAVQRVAGEVQPAYDQSAVAVGTSVALSATSAFKIEWQQVRVGGVSNMVEPQPGQADFREGRIRVLSASYSLTF